MSKDKNLFVPERCKAISAYLEKHKRATVEELSNVLFVSPATVRRDLAYMQRLGMIQRAHGGALYVEQGQDINIFVRMEQNSPEKEEAVAVALKHIPPFRSVFIDNSSSAFMVAQSLDLAHKTVITNGIELAAKIQDKKDVEIILLGGTISYNSYATMGIYALKMLREFNVDLSICGAAGADISGSSERMAETAEIKKEIFENSKYRMLVVGESKLSQNYLYKVKPLQEYDLVVTGAKDEVVEPFLKAGVKIVNQ